MRCEIDKLFDTIDAMSGEYVDFLRDICNIETPSEDKAALDRMADTVEKFTREKGFKVERIPFEKCGDFLLIDLNESAPRGAFFMAHMDVVQAKGLFGDPPVRVEGDRMIGPGTIDCKGGIAIALLAMEALRAQGYNKHLRLLLTSDEEVSNVFGGERELALIKEVAAGFPAALNCEVSHEGEVVISRSGIIRANITVRGVSAHAGIAYFKGKNAIEEMAHKILRLQGASREGGTTYSCALISGGKKLNIVPDECTLGIDVRVRSLEAMEKAREFIRAVTDECTVAGTSATLDFVSIRAPMVRDEAGEALFRSLCDVSERHGLGSLVAIESGGGSDSAYTQAAGVPSICAVGACGEHCHTDKEYAEIPSISARAKLLAAYCAEQ